MIKLLYNPSVNEVFISSYHYSHIMQLVHCACIFSGQVNVLQYIVAGGSYDFIQFAV